ASDRRGITATGSDQQIAVSQPKHQPVSRTVTIKIRPEDHVPRRVDGLQGITGECQAQALAAIDRIEENDDFSPSSRSSREPTRANGIGRGIVIGKES